MSTYLSEELRAGLAAARIAGLKRVSRLQVQAGDATYPVLRLWRGGFAVEAATTPPLRGFVDLCDGTRHLYQCLIVASGADGGEMRYDFKRSTAAADRPALDFCRDPDAPAALLGRAT